MTDLGYSFRVSDSYPTKPHRMEAAFKRCEAHRHEFSFIRITVEERGLLPVPWLIFTSTLLLFKFKWQYLLSL